MSGRLFWEFWFWERSRAANLLRLCLQVHNVFNCWCSVLFVSVKFYLYRLMFPEIKFAIVCHINYAKIINDQFHISLKLILFYMMLCLLLSPLYHWIKWNQKQKITLSLILGNCNMLYISLCIRGFYMHLSDLVPKPK